LTAKTKTRNATAWRDTPVSALRLAEWNYKVDDDEMTQKLAANIKRNGQVESILVRDLDDGAFEVVNGNHRLVAFRQLGITQAMCFHLGSFSEVDAKRLAIEVNETGFDPSYPDLAKLIREIAGGDDYTEESLASLTETMPFHFDQLEDFVKLSDVDWSNDFQLPDGDGTEMRKVPPVMVTEEQREIFLRACVKVRDINDSGKGSSDSEGRCLELICADFLSG